MDEFKFDASRLDAAWAEAHRRRTGHILSGYWSDPDADGIRTLVHTCCEG